MIQEHSLAFTTTFYDKDWKEDKTPSLCFFSNQSFIIMVSRMEMIEGKATLASQFIKTNHMTAF